MKSLIETAANKVSLIAPKWQNIAARLYLLQMYHRRFPAMKFQDGDYPHITEIFKRGMYSEDLLGLFTDEELETLNSMIVPSRDHEYTYAGIFYMFDKYCKGVELPQHTFMRVAMALFRRDNVNRLENIKTFYDALSQHHVTMATPIVINAGMKKEQLSSCILTKTGDSIESILETGFIEGIYSKFAGGIAIDVTDLRSRGSRIKGNNGVSAGPVGFIQIYESLIKRISQSGVRTGSAVVTFDWWHPDILDLVQLKRNDGIEDNRARHLKYSVRINKYLFDAVREDRDVKLVNPMKCPELANSYGDKWLELYENAPAAKMVPAREIMFEILKTRMETGNLYIFFTDNVNEQNRISDRFINSSNLCQEIVEPSRPSKNDWRRLFIDFGTEEVREISEKIPAEVALCNLASVNIKWYAETEHEERSRVVDVLVRAMDNSFEIAFYPVAGAEVSARSYRYIGIGIFNYAYMLAANELKFSDPESLEFVENIMKLWAEDIEYASEKLGKERGVYPAWRENHGPKRRNALTRAIAPTASSSRITGGTESIDPVRDWMVRLDATINLPFVVPEFNRLWKYYEKAFDIDPEVMIEHAAVRQKHLDQAQSVSLWLTGEYTTSAKKLCRLHEFALDKGIKTLYYAHTLKSGEEDVCESCT
jgi:ribonucleoside-diphosphate reductase alpha chain